MSNVGTVVAIIAGCVFFIWCVWEIEKVLKEYDAKFTRLFNQVHSLERQVEDVKKELTPRIEFIEERIDFIQKSK